MSNKVYELVTQKIIEKLEKGVVPWRKPFQSAAAVNWKTQKPYRGINTLLLDEGEYATRKQIIEAGGRIKLGQKSHIVVYWHWYKFKDKVQENVPDEEAKYIKGAKPFYYKVWEINTQVEGLQSKRVLETFEHDPIEEAEKVVKGYVAGPDYTFNPDGAWYKPFQDLINVPPIKDFKNAADFYSVLFHEMIHSTGHQSRLNREGITGHNQFGSKEYSKEELIAEMGASMLCGTVGIFDETIDNNAAYIKSWLKVFKEDTKMVVKAAQQAQKASDYILGVKHEEY